MSQSRTRGVSFRKLPNRSTLDYPWSSRQAIRLLILPGQKRPTNSHQATFISITTFAYHILYICNLTVIPYANILSLSTKHQYPISQNKNWTLINKISSYFCYRYSRDTARSWKLSPLQRTVSNIYKSLIFFFNTSEQRYQNFCVRCEDIVGRFSQGLFLLYAETYTRRHSGFSPSSVL